VAPTFSVGALALAAEGANAVGAVRLTLLPEVIEIELVRAAGFRSGFVPGGIAESVEMRVPYTAVRGLVRRGRALCLAVDPSVAAPYTRFTLARFTYDPREALGRAYEARRAAALSVLLLPGPLGLLAALAAPSSLVSGSVGRLSSGILAALVVWIGLRELLRFATWGGPRSDRLADAFEVALCGRLGFVPVTTPPFAPQGHGAPEPSSSSAFLPRALPIVGLMAILGVLGIALAKRYVRPAAPAELPLAVPLLTARVAPAWTGRPVEELVPAPVRLPRCVCARADSPLWSEGMRALEVLLAQRPEDGSGRVIPTAPDDGRPAFEFDLSVVNNAATSVRDISVLVTFARRDERGRRVGATDRGLFWGSTLLPGRAVKWHVSAPGTEMRIEPSIVGFLEPDREVAPPDAFAELGRARQRIVRIHAAKMLAYLRDPRALEVVTALGPASPGEDLVLARIARASRHVVACGITPVAASLDVCLFNSSLEPRRVAALSTVPTGETPSERLALSVEVGVHDGVRVSIPLAVRPPPLELDVELVEAP
jgi:hypothetical protein